MSDFPQVPTPLRPHVLKHPLYQAFYRPHANGPHEVFNVRAASRSDAINATAVRFNIPRSQVDGCVCVGVRGFGPR